MDPFHALNEALQPMFPELERAFFIIRGLIALIATCAYLWHMNKVWPKITRTSQRLRYLSLLGWAVLVTARSYTQFEEGASIEWYSLAAFALTTLLLAAAIQSIREQHDEFSHHHHY